MSGNAKDLSLSALNGIIGFRISGELAYDLAGRSVASAGDVNGDGFDDIIVGASTSFSFGLGAAYVVFGKASEFASNVNLSTLDGTTGFQINGAVAGDGFGLSVSSAGDVNGDGFDDLVIGAPLSDGGKGGEGSGAAYIVFGRTGSGAADVNVSQLNGTFGFKISGEAEYDFLGEVASAGDLNGDGFDDVIVGAGGANPNGNGSGAAYIVFGKAGGFALDLNLSELDGTTGFKISGEEAEDGAGYAVSAAGDVNGDGCDDVIVGANGVGQNPPPEGNQGAAYVVFGKAGAFSSNFELSTLNGSNGFVINGERTNDLAGTCVASAGDVNGDGFDDLLVGAPQAGSQFGFGYGGAVYVVFGEQGDFRASINLANLDGSSGFQISSGSNEIELGRSAASAGDFNGDGFDDIILGAIGTGDQSSCAAYVVFGKAGGFSPDLNLSELNGSVGFQINRYEAFDDAGRSVASAGDVNGDGFDDVVIGAPGSNVSGSNSGASYLIFGRASYPTRPTSGDDTLIGSSGDDTLSGLSGNDSIYGRARNDFLFGDSGNDLLFGESGNDTLNGGLGADRLMGGAGNDNYLTDERDTITESASQGTDTALSSASFTLGAHIENLVLTGSTAINGIGNNGVNRIVGNSGNNTLNGAWGADVLLGGAGNDVYMADERDEITESANQGTDTVRTSTSFILGAHLEDLVLSGSAAINGTGNNGVNRIVGNSGKNTLNGAGGADILIGGVGDDVYLTDGRDTITERGSQGTDTVRSPVSFWLSSNLEILNLMGTANISGAGNSLNNTLVGNSGANLLNGGLGSDILRGGGGRDTFVFDTTLRSKNVDRIADFKVVADIIQVDNADFQGLGRGPLQSTAFTANNSGNATDAQDRIIYERDTGKLFFDRDGTGTANEVHFATIGKNLTVTHADFFVF